MQRCFDDDGFDFATAKTRDGPSLRPRHNGYMGFQSAASARLNAGLIDKDASAAIIADLNRLYRESQ